LKERDPYKIDYMDTYSHVLYVKEDLFQLSQLARHASSVEKYHPVTASIIANYFSLRGEHEKAVMYFHRALSLDKNNLVPWILVGHSFVELKNIPLAIDAYNISLSINPKDSCAWYGLGQCYELQCLPHFALSYYTNAIRVRDKDGRLWVALAGCQESLNMKLDAIKSYERAFACSDKEGIAAQKLAQLNVERGKLTEAAKYYQSLIYGPNVGLTADVIEALKFMMDYSYRLGDVETCKKCATRLQDAGGSERNSAKNVLRELARGSKPSG